MTARPAASSTNSATHTWRDPNRPASVGASREPAISVIAIGSMLSAATKAESLWTICKY